MHLQTRAECIIIINKNKGKRRRFESADAATKVKEAMMKNQAVNPYMPSWEYVPDGEPHVFGDRVYVYGSHDQFDGVSFCLLDYVCWSAPVDDLSCTSPGICP